MTTSPQEEAWRHRRTAYSSGRREVIGAEKRDLNPFRRTTRKVKKKDSSQVARTPFRSNFRWKRN